MDMTNDAHEFGIPRYGEHYSDMMNPLPAIGMRFMKQLFPCFVLSLLFSIQASEPSISQNNDELIVRLGNGADLTFALEGDLILGLHTATVASTALTSSKTLQRPLIVQEFKEGRRLAALMRLLESKVVNGTVEIKAELLGTSDEDAYRSFFIFTGDTKKALDSLTPELQSLKEVADKAQLVLTTFIDGHPTVQKVLEDKKNKEAIVQDEKAKGKAVKQAKKWLRDLDKKHLPRARSKAKPEVLKAHPEAVQANAQIQAFKKALQDYAVEKFGRIHRDFYRFAHLRMPSKICTVDYQKGLAASLRKSCEPMGTITWILTPESRTIAGWPWKGWTQSYKIELSDNEKVNVVRQLGTWELGGQAIGTTAVGMRYRGLGKIEQSFTDAGNGTVAEAWTTTEIIPGAAGGGYAVSPVIPASESVNDRGYAIKHRLGAWISKCARGAGAPFYEFQYRPKAAFTSFPVRYGNTRALSECFPGDTTIGQTDEEFFALTPQHTTVPLAYLALVHDDELPQNEWRTRWQEVDQHLRDDISAELGFIPHEPLPGVGTIASGQPKQLLNQYNDKVLTKWHKQGVRMIASHSPGWVNGEIFRNGKMLENQVNGGECAIYQMVPAPNLEDSWKAFQKRAAKLGMRYYPWIGMTIKDDSPFIDRVGRDKKNWGLNTPFDEHGAGYAPMKKGNVHSQAFREAYLHDLNHSHKEFGYQGFWIDSFQNLMMSQLAWADAGDHQGDSMQRAWWDIIADWSKQGIGLMSESHGFPGMSCSIEIHGWEKEHFFFQHTWKWMRAGGQDRFSSDELDAMMFRFMANKSWLAPDRGYTIDKPFKAENFGRYANEYLAALPSMRRSWILPNNRGMLWCPYGSNNEGILFPFDDMPVIKGMTALGILDNQSVEKCVARHTYKVSGEELPTLLGMAKQPHQDTRMTKTYVEPKTSWPDWAEE